MKSILYLMHVPWRWIKQRPHFFAEYLANDYNVEVRFKHPLKVDKSKLLNNQNKINAKGFWQLPLHRLPVIKNFECIFSWINRLLINKGIPNIKKYDYVWITSIYFWKRIKHKISESTILIWDCMDDELEFENTLNNKKQHNEYLKSEKELMVRANTIFCSASYLANKMKERSGVAREIIIVNNAVKLPEKSCDNSEIEPKYLELAKHKNIFMYIGAVSEWFDFDTLIAMVDNNPEAIALIVGPADVVTPQHPQIIYLGTVPRSDIFELMSYAKVLMMPFKVTELIKSVNPVKLYEYIYGDKIVLAPRYGESEKFEDYIYLYNNSEDFNRYAKEIISGTMTTKSSTLQNILFAESNQWSNRYEQIQKTIKETYR